jgi:AcrR family transcriptional regulator
MTRPTKAQAARAAREHQIVTAARSIAETDGWPAVTVRRLADAIGYSQPVLYGHFPDGRDGIVRAVAIEGFERLATVLAGIGTGTAGPARVRAVVQRYLAFARDNPAVYDAMFSMPIGLAFATSSAPAPLREAFAAINYAVAGADADPETRAELLWSALHGLAELSRHKRLRPSHEQARVRLLVELFS